ncbi:beta-glucosidase [Mariniphaga anaerophila]|uniref:Beta-glucosidase n=1 Tax=Mariniphaga anaerophila TaxID=1484053 RepID=A0A1M4SF34_9BACT|nr:glycoside hydrolase family 3 C-terminal domain-containing protein [Mariniphaga anaerophila]SHE30820.1 beta-glucosidase [Mariniphaga anaerophila]
MMRKELYIFLVICLSCTTISTAKVEQKKHIDSSIYNQGWIDLNKNGKKDIYEDPEALIDDRIEDLLSQMNMEEKTCQMVTLYGYRRVLKDSLPTPEWENALWKDGIGAIDEHLNGFAGWGRPPMESPLCWPASNHAEALNEVQRFFIEKTRLGIPADFTNEGIRGVENYIATNFPTQLALGQTWNRELIREVGNITGKEARLLGYTNVYAPILDVARDQRWGRMEEVYGESPFLVAELGIEMTKGLQTNYQVASTAKHFAIYSNNKGAREGLSRVDPQIAPRETELIHLYPFRRVIREAGLLGVMSSYNDYDGMPIQSSFYYLTEVLRNRFNFKGYVVSDSDAVLYLYSKHHTAENYKEAVRQSVEAGLNVRCTFRSPESFVEPLRELIQDGAISEELINERVRDVLRVKFLIGLFDEPYVKDIEKADETVNSTEHQNVALQASRESIILLKNEGEILPLDKSKVKKIAVIGPNANDGSYALTHYGPLAVEVSTVLDGIREKAGENTEVVYEKGCELVDATWPDSELFPVPLTETEKAGIEKAVEAARNADVSVVVVGGSQRTCGENKSRTSLELPGKQNDLIRAIWQTGKPVVLVVISGRPLSINWPTQYVPGILQAFYPGAEGGTAIADVLFGDYNPGGKLTVTVPKTAGQIPFKFPSKPGAQIDAWGQNGPSGSRARVNGALFPFGYGLSYTTFLYNEIKVTPATITPSQSFSVSFKIKNTGDRAGDEVVQLYLRDEVSSVTTYEKVLRGFQRVHLNAGEETEVTFTLKPEDLAFLDENMEYIVEPGTFKIMIGASSEDIKLEKELQVLDEGESASTFHNKKDDKFPFVHPSENKTQISNLFDNNENTLWTATQKGASIDFELKEGAVPTEMGIRWAKGTDDVFRFEIQLSGGGGQFIPVYSGKSNGSAEVETYSFDGYPASDLRLILFGTQNNSKSSIAEIVLRERK